MASFQIPFSNSLLLLSLLLPISTSTDTITPSTSISATQTLISTAGNFELGFFTPGASTNRYVGIWYKKAPPENKYAWVANREHPIPSNSSAVISIVDDGNLAIVIDGRSFFRITNSSTAGDSAQLLDSGNLVLKDEKGRLLWQSFDYPTHTMLPGMKLGLDRKTGLIRVITSWKSDSDPASGDYVLRLNPYGSPQFFLLEGSKPLWRSGPWTGVGFSGVPLMNHQTVVTYHFTVDSVGIFYSYDLNNQSVFSRLILDPSGHLQRLAWEDGTPKWNPFWRAPDDQCDGYAICGTDSTCNVNKVGMCECLQGFKPKVPQAWNLHDWSGGCDRQKGLACAGDGFLKLKDVKLPDTSAAARLANVSSLKECRDICLKNCSCSAYAGAHIEGWNGECLIWGVDLTDLKQYSDGGMDFYVRLAASELNSSSRKKTLVLIVIFSIIPGLLLLLACGYCFRKKKIQRKGAEVNERGPESFTYESELREESGKSSELPLFNAFDVALATDHFSDVNKLGEGGFGPVYKGRLRNGQQIAVKRLSRNSGQGIEEFKNEVTVIAQLQHRNLVRILGCCTQGEENMLIYEYMQNKSLDSFIFDRTKRSLLDWNTRFNIIIGIARGVLYLHHDSRLRIIHRDLKASNVLLDDEMNPKISDFGMARIFGGNQTQANTNRVVGTYGYMAPEYAIDGLFSVKSDVFSFGVLLLEIISGTKNSGYYNRETFSSLIGHAWDLWKEGRSLELVESTIVHSCSTGEVLRCIHVGLLCVQESAASRPTMLSVVSMLGNDTPMPAPRKPAYSSKKNFFDPDSSTSNAASHSTNEITVTELEAR